MGQRRASQAQAESERAVPDACVSGLVQLAPSKVEGRYAGKRGVEIEVVPLHHRKGQNGAHRLLPHLIVRKCGIYCGDNGGVGIPTDADS